MADDADSLAELYRAKDLIEAELIEAALQDAGLTARVDGEYLGAAYPLGFAEPRILVPADQLSAAQQILADYQAAISGENPAADSDADDPGKM